MSKFIAYVEQDGEGCDYTIGCGLSVIDLDAESLEDATAEALREYPPWEPGSERDIKKITIYEVRAEHDIADALDAEVERLKAEHAADERAAKKRKIEALKREIGE